MYVNLAEVHFSVILSTSESVHIVYGCFPADLLILLPGSFFQQSPWLK